MPSMPVEGAKAPPFDLPSHRGGSTSLASLKGRVVVLYFYPKDNTPGCTVEAQGFAALAQDFETAGAVVLGVSPDSVASHCKFADKYGLGFTLLADSGHEAAESFGVWVEKKQYGRTFMGIQRATFLINAAGKISRVWPKVKPEGHAAEVLEAVKALQ